MRPFRCGFAVAAVLRAHATQADNYIEYIELAWTGGSLCAFLEQCKDAASTFRWTGGSLCAFLEQCKDAASTFR
jgi:hypothetical protein